MTVLRLNSMKVLCLHRIITELCRCNVSLVCESRNSVSPGQIFVLHVISSQGAMS